MTFPLFLAGSALAFWYSQVKDKVQYQYQYYDKDYDKVDQFRGHTGPPFALATGWAELWIQLPNTQKHKLAKYAVSTAFDLRQGKHKPADTLARCPVDYLSLLSLAYILARQNLLGLMPFPYCKIFAIYSRA